jgi:5'-nucleotidase
MISPALDWPSIDTVLLDMDGTLLDLHFDNHFWSSHVPARYAAKRGLSPEAAGEELRARYHARAGSLDWYSVDYWEAELELDIMRLKEEVAHLIAVHPGVTDFLGAVRDAGKRLLLVTNAHHRSVALKMARTGLTPHFDAIVTSHELGLPKEDRGFWARLRSREPFEPERTLLVDDSLPVLDSAKDYGIRHLLAVLRPDSRLPCKPTAPYEAISGFEEIRPPVRQP